MNFNIKIVHFRGNMNIVSEVENLVLIMPRDLILAYWLVMVIIEGDPNPRMDQPFSKLMNRLKFWLFFFRYVQSKRQLIFLASFKFFFFIIIRRENNMVVDPH
jgi:hypothetical protein